MNRSVQVILLVAAVIALGLIVIFVETPENTRFWLELYTAGHTLIFGLCALAFLRLSIMQNGQSFRFRMVHYGIAFIFAVSIGISTEIIQGFVGRDAEMADVYRDALGALAFLCAFATFDTQLTWEWGFGRMVRQVVRLAAPLLILVIFLPAMKWGLAYLYRDHEFPVVGSFNDKVMRQFMRTADCKLTITDPPRGWIGEPGKVGRLTFYPSTYPGLLFRELSPNWSGYSALTFGIYSDLPDTVSVEFRVNDRHHNEKYSDRYNANIHVRPGVNEVVIPLEKLRNAPSMRKMDLTDMGTIVLFAYKPKDTFSIYVSDLRLE